MPKTNIDYPITMHFRVEQQLFDQIERLAQLRGVTKSRILRNAVLGYLRMITPDIEGRDILF